MPVLALIFGTILTTTVDRDRAVPAACSSIVVRAHSIEQPRPSTTRLIQTNDGSILLSVVKPVRAPVTSWSTGTALLGSHHGFSGLEDDEERIDVTQPFTSVIVRVGSLHCPVDFVNLQKPDGKSGEVAMLQRGDASRSLAIGTVVFSPQVRLDDTIMAYDGDALLLSGHLVIDTKLRTIELVSLQVDRDGLRLRNATAHLAMPTDAPFSSMIPMSLTAFSLPFVRNAAVSVSRPTASARLSLPADTAVVTEEGRVSGTITLVRRPDGSFVKEWARAAEFRWPQRRPCDVGSINSIRVSPDGIPDENGRIHHLLASGSIAFAKPGGPCPANASTIALVAAGEVFQSSLRRPSVAFLMNPKTVLSADPNLKFTAIRGWFDENRVAHLTLAGMLKITLPSLVKEAFARRRLFASTASSDDIANVPFDAMVPFENVEAVVPADQLTDGTQWTLAFDKATIANTPEVEGLFFEHKITSCVVSDKDKASTVTRGSQICLGVHLERGDQDPLNLINVTLNLCGTRVNDRAPGSEVGKAAILCHVPSQPFGIKAFTAKLPKDAKAEVRVGVARLNFSGIEFSTQHPEDAAAKTAEEAPDPTTFSDVISAEQLARLGCKGFDATGFATLASFEVPGVVPNTAFAISQSRTAQEQTPSSSFQTGAAATAMAGQPPQTVGSLDAAHPFIPTIPRVGFGRGCSLFALTGWFPIQLSAQSSIVITSLVFVHGKGKRSDPIFLNGAGLLTSGNVTVVFRSLGFRTLNDADIADAEKDAPIVTTASDKPPAADHKAHELVTHRIDACVKGEGRLGRYCLREDVDFPLTLTITGARNTDAIEKAIAGAGSFLIGLLIGHH